MGIDSNFVLPVKDHLSVFTCSLCTKIVSLDGYVTIPCHHSFCMNCFSTWMVQLHTKSKTCDCPNCGVSILAKNKYAVNQHLNLSNVLVRPLVVAQPLMHRMLRQVKVLCPCRSSTSFCSWHGDYVDLDQHLSSCHKAKRVAEKTSTLDGKFSKSQQKLSSSNPPRVERLDAEDSRATSVLTARGRAMERASSEKRVTSVPRSQDIFVNQSYKSMSDLNKSKSGHRRLLPSDSADSSKGRISCRERESSDNDIKSNESSTSKAGTKSSSRRPIRSDSSDEGIGMNRSNRHSRSSRRSASSSPKRSHSKARSSKSPMRSRELLKPSNALDLKTKLLEELRCKASNRSSSKRPESRQSVPQEVKRKISKDSSLRNGSRDEKQQLHEELKRKASSEFSRKRPGSRQSVPQQLNRKLSKNSLTGNSSGNQKKELLEELKRRTSKSSHPKRPESKSKQQVLHETKRAVSNGASNSSNDGCAMRSSQSSSSALRSSTLRRGERRTLSRSPYRTNEKKLLNKPTSTSPVISKEKRLAPLQSPSPISLLTTKPSDLSTFAVGIKTKANKAFKECRYQDAIDLYTEAIDKYIFSSSSTDADKDLIATLYGNRAAGYLKQGLFMSCLNDCESALALNSYMPRACLRKAWALKEMGCFEQACNSLEKGIADNPDVKELEEEMVYTQKLLQEFEKLEDWLTRQEYGKVKQSLAKMSLTINRAVLMEGAADLGLGNAADTILSLNTKILSTDTTNATALELLAQAHFQKGDFDNAIQAAKSAIRYQGKSSKLHIYENAQIALLEARSAFDQRNFEKAITTYSSEIGKCIHLPPMAQLRLTLFVERAEAYLCVNKLEESLRDSMQVLSWDKGSVSAWITRVKTFQVLQDYPSITRELGPVVNQMANKFLQGAYQESLHVQDHTDLYKLFEVARNASVEEIKKQYKTKARESHPDRFMGHTEGERREAEEKFKLLGVGVALLSDSFQRSLYDTGHDLDTIRVQADAMQRRDESQRQATTSG